MAAADGRACCEAIGMASADSNDGSDDARSCTRFRTGRGGRGRRGRGGRGIQIQCDLHAPCRSPTSVNVAVEHVEHGVPRADITVMGSETLPFSAIADGDFSREDGSAQGNGQQHSNLLAKADRTVTFPKAATLPEAAPINRSRQVQAKHSVDEDSLGSIPSACCSGNASTAADQKSEVESAADNDCYTRIEQQLRQFSLEVDATRASFLRKVSELDATAKQARRDLLLLRQRDKRLSDTVSSLEDLHHRRCSGSNEANNVGANLQVQKLST
uniref:Uncharacterized protein n=1 Tax=Chrysotila carterae TaxID=13221 RepID=A0A7S4BCM9_CHRCT